VTVAEVDDLLRVQKIETWFDPLEMFRQIAPNGKVEKEAVAVASDDAEPLPAEPIGGCVADP
jgi:hypothetical protein